MGATGVKRALLGLPAAAAGAATLAAWAAARRITSPGPVEERYFTPWELQIPYEEVAFRTADGVTLRGWWMDNPDARRTVITLAGHNGARHHTLGIGSALWRRGANVLLFDNRGRGTSDRHITSLGYYETEDARAAVEYARARSSDPVGLLGFSMGGAVAVMVAARDERVGVVVADSPFAAQRELIRHSIRQKTPLPALPLSALIEQFLPYDVEAVAPLREVAGISPRACLFIHGTDDLTTNPEDSQALYAAAGEPKELWMPEGVGHCGAYFADRDAYAARVGSFFERHLSG
jgi:alpha-beta hydrolase superfamily lysophospholipase